MSSRPLHSAQRGKGLAIAREVAGLTDRILDRPLNDAVPVDEERAPARSARTLVEHAVRVRHGPVRPEVTENVEGVAIPVRERPVREEVVTRNREHLDVVVEEQAQVVANLAQLSGA